MGPDYADPWYSSGTELSGGIVLSGIEIREAVIADAELILGFVTELARYEKAEHEVRASVNDIRESIFGPDSTTHALICSNEGTAVGFAVYFFNYSTWLGKNGLYLEDLYVSPEHRNAGAGKALLIHLARIALTKNCGRFEWSVLDWNEPAINFYQSLGANAQEEWVAYRLQGEEIEALARS
ncbi:MAG: GNAT family N-acetyltransferase [Gammaproteobacteria bacterium]|nr:GNAT family N-acetyltransferase [Gammaproteobacteria bacterium]